LNSIQKLYRNTCTAIVTLRMVVEVKVTLRPTVSRSVCFGIGHAFGAHDQILLFLFLCRTMALLFVLGRPPRREDGSVICSAICRWSESRRTHNHTLLAHLRLLRSHSVVSYDSQGLRWKYSYPPPHGELRIVRLRSELIHLMFSARSAVETKKQSKP
jgi:hypothetical protein